MIEYQPFINYQLLKILRIPPLSYLIRFFFFFFFFWEDFNSHKVLPHMVTLILPLKLRNNNK